MSELTASQCGCCEQKNNGCGSWIWILILLFCCGGCVNNNGCEWIIILLILCNCCGGNHSFC